MVETFRETPLKMDVIFKTLVEGIKSYLAKNKIGVAVLGLSGGIYLTD